MSDAPTSTDKRRNSDANPAILRRRLNGKESILPSYFGTFGKFSGQFLCESRGPTTEHYLQFDSRFPTVSGFVAIV
jgi:hypothetical protein